MTTIRVAIADDQVLFCSGVEMLIDSQPDLSFAGAAHNGVDAVELVTRERPDVILMDVRMPGIDGIEATRRIIEASAPTGASADADADADASTPDAPATKIIVLTTLQRDDAVARAIQAGAHGFIIKDTTPEFILASIRTVHAGHSVIAPNDVAELFRATLAKHAQDADDDAIAALSSRESEIFLLAARGLSNSEIGQTAYISEATVKSHVRSILAKLELSSRAQLIAFAYEHRLVRPAAAGT